jgi:hypothetical protein
LVFWHDRNGELGSAASALASLHRDDITDLGRYGEHGAEVGHRQELGLALRKPVCYSAVR